MPMRRMYDLESMTMIMPIEWTTTPPTEAGWYWAWHKSDGPLVRLVQVWLPGGVFFQTGEPQIFAGGVTGLEKVRLETFSHWMGPVPVPPAPLTEHSP